MKYSVEISKLSKYYGTNRETTALRSIDLEVSAGRLFGLIGPDGSGKTTLFRILTSLILPDEGRATVLGYDVIKDYKKIRSIVGYMPGKFSLYQDLSVKENLNFFATLFGTSVEQNFDLIRDIYVQLEPFKKRRAGALSGGMKQKLALCCALIHRPEILFLDEPTTGVDAVSRREFWEMLKRLNKEGITVFVSTPYMDEAMLCDEIALIQEGTILSTDSPEGMAAQMKEQIYGFQSEDMYHLLLVLEEHSGVRSVHTFGDFHHVILMPGFNPEKISGEIRQNGFPELTVVSKQATIEDVFLDLMKINPQIS